METVISPDGKLPASFHEAFGRKVRVIVLFQEEDQNNQNEKKGDEAVNLMDVAGKIQSLKK